MEEGLTLTLPSRIDFLDAGKTNMSVFLTRPTSLLDDNGADVSAQPDPDYEQFLADVWVGIVLTLMVLSCVCCMCSCLLYHKFQQWKRTGESIDAHPFF